MVSRPGIAAVIVGLLVGGVAYDRLEHVRAAPAPVPAPAAANPSMAEPSRLSSVWYCPVGSAGGGYAEHTVEVSNVGDEPAVATVSVLTDEGPGPSLRVELAAGSRREVALAELETAAAAGAVVEVLSGQGAVNHVVATPHGPVRGPCATSASDQWHFAGGVTTRDATYQLALLNPFPEDAVVDVRLQAADRSRLPSNLQGAIVPARSTRVIDVSAAVAREGAVATTVQLRRGRVVAERLQSFSGVLGPVGSVLELGSPAGAVESWFPAGEVHAGGDQRLVLYNPSSTVAEVDVELVPDDPDLAATYGLVPIEVSIGAGRFEIVDLRATATQLGVPLPIGLGLHVVGVNQVPIVAERWSLSPALNLAAIGADPVPVAPIPPEGPPPPGAPGDVDPAPGTPATTPATDPAPPAPGVDPAAAAATPAPSIPAEPAGGPAGTAPPPAAAPPSAGPEAVAASTGEIPAPIGVGIDRGLSTTAKTWALAGTTWWTPEGTVLVVMGGDQPSTVTVREVGGGVAATAEVPAGHRVVVPIRSDLALADLVVSATAPVVVASSAAEPGGPTRVANGVPILEEPR